METRRLFTCQRNVRLHSFSICSKLHISAYNKWTTWCVIYFIYYTFHIFETQGIVDRVTQLKIFISLFRTVAWGLNFVLLIQRNWQCLFWHMYVCKKNYKLVLKFFKYIYQGLHISVSRKGGRMVAVLHRCLSRILKVHYCKFENLSICLCSYKNNILKTSHSEFQEFSSYLPVKFVFLLKSRLLFNAFYCFCMFVNKHFAYLRCAYLKGWKV